MEKTFEGRFKDKTKDFPEVAGINEVLSAIGSGATALERVRILDTLVGGYAESFRDYVEMCEVRGYVSMKDAWLRTHIPESGRYDDAYRMALNFVLEVWGHEQAKNLHVDVSDELKESFGVAAQVCVPGIHFPPGHYDFEGSVICHPAVPVTCGPRDSTRFWFKQGKGDDWENLYMNDDAWWIKESPEVKPPNSFKRLACFVAPHSVHWVRDEEEYRWQGRNIALLGANVRAMFDAPSVGFLAMGHQTNLEVDIHFMPTKHRKSSVCFNQIPASEIITGRLAGAAFGTSPHETNDKMWDTKLADAQIKVFSEFCKTAVYFNGWGCRVEALVYYGILGVHHYGQSPRQGNFIECHTSNQGGNWPKEKVVSVIDRGGLAHVRIPPGNSYWSGESKAPRDAGGFKKGQVIF